MSIEGTVALIEQLATDADREGDYEFLKSLMAVKKRLGYPTTSALYEDLRENMPEAKADIALFLLLKTS